MTLPETHPRQLFSIRKRVSTRVAVRTKCTRVPDLSSWWVEAMRRPSPWLRRPLPPWASLGELRKKKSSAGNCDARENLKSGNPARSQHTSAPFPGNPDGHRSTGLKQMEVARKFWLSSECQSQETRAELRRHDLKGKKNHGFCRWGRGPRFPRR